MRTYEERAGYILKQRDIRLAKRRRIRTAVTMSAVSVCSLALIVGAGIAVNRMADRKGAIWISPGGASSGVSANPREPAFPTELIYNREKCATASNFTMPEFPGVDFKVDDNVVSIMPSNLVMAFVPFS